MSPRLDAQLAFLTEADRLKEVLRASRLTHDPRHENSAEHSWHVMLYALVLADQAKGPIAKFLSDEKRAALAAATSAKTGDAIFFVSEQAEKVGRPVDGLRTYLGRELEGRVMATFVDGRCVFVRSGR